MELHLVNPNPKYAPPAFLTPPVGGYLHIAAAVAPPAGPPVVRKNARREALLTQLKQLAAELERQPDVTAVTVYRAILMPPGGQAGRHPARYDVAVLAETSSPEALDPVRAAPTFQRMLSAISTAASDLHLMAARCIRYLGPVDRRRQGLFLFNHFAAEDAKVATALWEHLAGWYVAETGLSNSMLLAPTGESDYVLVNHARWDKSPLRLAAEQFGKRTFRSYVRANLRTNHVVAMPILFRLA